MGTEMDFTTLTKQRILSQVFAPLSKSAWYVTVVDKNSLRVLSTHLKLSELLDYNVSVVDPLELRRKSASHAVYFLSPVNSSVTRLLEDFTRRDGPLYANAHVFFTSKLSERLLGLIKGCPSLLERLRALKEVHAEFEAVEPRTFTVGAPAALRVLLGERVAEDHQARTAELNKIAQRLATVFTALRARPDKILVRTPQELPDLPGADLRRCLCRELGQLVQERLSRWALADGSLFPGAPCDLLILDRGHDPVAPAVHAFTYAAMTHDLVPLAEGNVFTYSWTDARGQAQTSEHAIDESDEMWRELRHAHIAEVANTASERLQTFTSSRLARIEREGGDGGNLGKAAAGLPEYLAQKSRLSMHVSLSQAIFQAVDRRDLIVLGRLEQELIFGEKKSKDIIASLQAWNNRRATGTPTLADKMRMLLCYITTHPGRFDAKNQDNWAGVAGVPADGMRTLRNVQYLGVELAKAKRSAFSFTASRGGKATRVFRGGDGARKFEADRFRPLLAETFADFVSGRLQPGPGAAWDIVRGNAEFDAPAADSGGGRVGIGAKSVRTTSKPTWHRRAASGANGSGGPPLGTDAVSIRSRVAVVFVVGGVTWSEVQAAYELSAQHGVEVVLGSTGILNGGDEYLQQLSSLSDAPEATALSMEGPPRGAPRR